MKCPVCQPGRGRPKDYTLPELADHFLEKHPVEALTMGRDLLKKAGVSDVDVVWKKDGEHGA